MKKTLLSLVAFTLLCISANAQNVNIPDANFKTALINHFPKIDTDSDKEISNRIKELLKETYTQLVVNQVTFNKVNRFVTTPVKVTSQNIIKTFENFRYKI